MTDREIQHLARFLATVAFVAIRGQSYPVAMDDMWEIWHKTKERFGQERAT